LSNWVTWVEFDWDEAQEPNLAGLRGMIPFASGVWYGRDGGDYYTRGGFGSIPEFIAEDFAPNQILLNERVISIEYGTNGVIVSTNSGIFEADQVNTGRWTISRLRVDAFDVFMCLMCLMCAGGEFGFRGCEW